MVVRHVIGGPVGRGFRGILLGVAMVVAASGASAQESSLLEDLGRAVLAGTPTVDGRYRIEAVDQAGIQNSALASTFRLRLGYTTGTFHGLFVHGDVEVITNVGRDRFNSTSNGKTDFPVVGDPEDTEVNQAYLGFRAGESTTFMLGRKRVILDNHRFVGNVGWRQNEQTYDGVFMSSNPTEGLDLTYGYVSNVNRVFGAHHPTPGMADLDVAAHLVNLSYLTQPGTITAYSYLVDLVDDPIGSHRTVGVRLNGQQVLTDVFNILYTAEYADQAAYKGGAALVDAQYYHGIIGVGVRGVTTQVGVEVLGGDGTYGFSTPLATLHAFNGWADKFLATPTAGLEDRYVSVAGSVRQFSLKGVHHKFSANQGASDYGTELDLVVSRNFASIHTVSLKYAGYYADQVATDTSKLWLSLQLKY
jgi:hypothetical protein